MPVQEYECPRKHITPRTISLAKSPGPKWIKCKQHRRSSTHAVGCAQYHVCGLRAKRREVYSVSVGGDLPTRGAF